ncbi:MAG: hypothetical protein GY953_39505 [bacterium]|nr:hypothetical protein [bacterium]
MARVQESAEEVAMMSWTTLFAVLLVAIPASADAADKPRVFLTESGALLLSGDAAVGDEQGKLSLTGGSSRRLIEVMRTFTKRCPELQITSNRDKADYIARFDHEGANPTTPFVRGNKVAIFDNTEDLIYSHSTRLLRNAVKGACAAITEHSSGQVLVK